MAGTTARIEPTPEIAGAPTTGGTEQPHALTWLGVDAEGFVALAFLLFVGLLLYVKAPKMITQALDGRAAKVRGDLDEAKRLRAEAEAMLAGYRAKADTASHDVEHILATARTEAAGIVTDAHAAADAVIARRTAQAETKIAAAERAAEVAVRAQAVDLATGAAHRIIVARDDPAEAARLTAASISELDRRLH
jgi:F-type H+-transporting ATPase subunit b